MNRGDVVRMVAHQTGMTVPESRRLVTAVFDSIELSLKCGEEVTIIRFGRFYPQVVPAATRPDPGTGVRRAMAEGTTVGFIPSVRLRNRMKR